MSMPPPDEPITVAAYYARWPMGAEKCELLDGVVVWYGEFEAEDCAAAERAFPGRIAVLADGVLELRPATADKPDRGEG